VTANAILPVQDVEARIDKLTQALMHLAGELWVMRDRQAVLERLLAEGGVSAPTLIDSYRPDAALAEKLAAEREAFVASIVAILAPDA
jgi:hypothetical protein